MKLEHPTHTIGVVAVAHDRSPLRVVGAVVCQRIAIGAGVERRVVTLRVRGTKTVPEFVGNTLHDARIGLSNRTF